MVRKFFCHSTVNSTQLTVGKMESVGTPHPYKSDHMTVGGSKSRVLEKFLIIFLLYEAPGTEFQATECYRSLVDSVKTSETLVEPIANRV